MSFLYDTDRLFIELFVQYWTSTFKKKYLILEFNTNYRGSPLKKKFVKC